MADYFNPLSQRALLSHGQAKLIRALHRKKGRELEREFLVEGMRALQELAQCGAVPEILFARIERVEELAEIFPEHNIYEIVGEGGDLFATEHSQGVGAVVEQPLPPKLDQILSLRGPLLYLDGIADPGNLGTIIRTAEWFGMAGILMSPGCVDLYNPKVVRSTVGALFGLPIIQGIEPSALLHTHRPLFLLDASGEKSLGISQLLRNGIYAIGSEAHGASVEIKALAEFISIRGTGRVESLNAAVAAALVCYELSRGS